MSKPKNWTRLDVFKDAAAWCDFMDWAVKRNPKTKEDMQRLLEEYKKADLMIEEHKERIEAHLAQAARKGAFKQSKKEPQ